MSRAVLAIVQCVPSTKCGATDQSWAGSERRERWKGEGRVREKVDCAAVGRGSRGIFKMFVLIVGEGDTRPYAFVKPIEPYKE